MRGVRTFIATISILTVGIASADEIKTMSAFIIFWNVKI